MDRIRTELARAITTAIRVKRMSQSQAVATLGISQPQLSKLMRGTPVSLRLMLQVWEKLGGTITFEVHPPFRADLPEWRTGMGIKKDKRSTANAFLEFARSERPEFKVDAAWIIGPDGKIDNDTGED